MSVSKQQSIAQYGTEAYTGWGEAEAAADAKAHPEKLGIPGGNAAANAGGAGGNLQSAIDATNAKISDLTSRYTAAVPEATTAAYNEFDVPTWQNLSSGIKQRMDTISGNLANQGGGGYASGAQVDQAISSNYAPRYEAAAQGLQTAAQLAQQQITNTLLPYTTEASLLGATLPSEVSATGGLQGTLAQLAQQTVTPSAGQYVYNTATGQYQYMAPSSTVSTGTGTGTGTGTSTVTTNTGGTGGNTFNTSGTPSLNDLQSWAATNVPTATAKSNATSSVFPYLSDLQGITY